MKRTFLLWGLIVVILIVGIIMILFSKHEVVSAERERARGGQVRGDMPEGPILPEPPKSKKIVGIDFLPEAREAIIKGEQLASFTYPTCGKVGVKAALRLLKGKKVERYISVPSQLVTKKNVKAISTVY